MHQLTVSNRRYGSLADIVTSPSNVRFTPECGHSFRQSECPLWAIFRLMQCSKTAPLFDRRISARQKTLAHGLVKIQTNTEDVIGELHAVEDDKRSAERKVGCQGIQSPVNRLVAGSNPARGANPH